jgi:hypothetical protein
MAGEGYNRPGFWPLDVEQGGRMTLKAAGSQTWKRGDMLALSSGLVIIAVAGSAKLIGVAGDDRTSTTEGDEVPVVGTNPDAIFCGRADADPSSLVTGDLIDLVGTTGAMMFDVGASTTDVFAFLKIHEVPGQSDSAQYALLECRISHGKHGLQ